MAEHKFAILLRELNSAMNWAKGNFGMELPMLHKCLFLDIKGTDRPV
jgi:hypothetical protein